MRTVTPRHTDSLQPRLEPSDTPQEGDSGDAFDGVPVLCPECARPLSVRAPQSALPEHAVCATPWDPFGVTVCDGSGRPAAEATWPSTGDGSDIIGPVAALAVLPEGLHWRLQPFSHRSGPGSVQRPRQPVLRQAA